MTAIVGLVDNGRVWMGADSAAHAGCERFPRTDLDRKLFRRGDMLVGWCGPSRIGQILEHLLEIPVGPADATLPAVFAYLVKDLMPALKATIDHHGGVQINVPSDGWSFLLGYRGGLWYVCHDLTISPLPEYGACGCGSATALGSLHTTGAMMSEERWLPEDRVRAALEAAAEWDIHVAPPFVIEVAE